jgi:hypothetical protein
MRAFGWQRRASHRHVRDLRGGLQGTSLPDSAQNDDVDLSNGDREPIHELGAVQPFGYLLALSTDWLVQRASANVGEFFGGAAQGWAATPPITSAPTSCTCAAAA